MNYLVTFHTHFDAIQYVKFLKTRGLKSTLKPVPRRISSSCGTCAFFTSETEIVVEDFVKEGCDEIFSTNGNNYDVLYMEET